MRHRGARGWDEDKVLRGQDVEVRKVDDRDGVEGEAGLRQLRVHQLQIRSHVLVNTIPSKYVKYGSEPARSIATTAQFQLTGILKFVNNDEFW